MGVFAYFLFATFLGIYPKDVAFSLWPKKIETQISKVLYVFQPSSDNELLLLLLRVRWHQGPSRSFPACFQGSWQQGRVS